ncbi:MAG: hypothetical protein NTV51_24640, partial [Verrucomicrobia bacterium]|nr:hypothetical protein [Verrucomicrobiota bacterium]
MLFEEKLHGAAKWASVLTVGIGALSFSDPAATEAAKSLVSLGLMVAGAALWFEVHGRTGTVRRILATVALACALAALAKLASDGVLSADEISFRDTEPRPPAPTPVLPHAAVALAVAAAALLAVP